MRRMECEKRVCRLQIHSARAGSPCHDRTLARRKVVPRWKHPNRLQPGPRPSPPPVGARRPHRARGRLGALPPRRRGPLGPPPGRPPAPPGRVRRHLGRDPARPEGRPRRSDRPAPRRDLRREGVPERVRPPGRPARRRRRPLERPGRLKAWWFYRMLFRPDPLAERLTLDVAQPLRHQQPQGAEPRR